MRLLRFFEEKSNGKSKGYALLEFEDVDTVRPAKVSMSSPLTANETTGANYHLLANDRAPIPPRSPSRAARALACLQRAETALGNDDGAVAYTGGARQQGIQRQAVRSHLRL